MAPRRPSDSVGVVSDSLSLRERIGVQNRCPVFEHTFSQRTVLPAGLGEQLTRVPFEPYAALWLLAVVAGDDPSLGFHYILPR